MSNYGLSIRWTTDTSQEIDFWVGENHAYLTKFAERQVGLLRDAGHSYILAVVSDLVTGDRLTAMGHV